MALAARLWCFLPLGRGAAAGPGLARGVAGKRRWCCTWRLRGPKVSRPFWLPLPTAGRAPAALPSGLAAPRHLRDCVEVKKKLGQVCLERARDQGGQAHTFSKASFPLRKLGSEKEWVPPLHLPRESVFCLPIFCENTKMYILWGENLGCCENFRFRWCHLQVHLRLSVYQTEKFVVWFWAI